MRWFWIHWKESDVLYSWLLPFAMMLFSDGETMRICSPRRMTRRCLFCCCMISNKVHPLENILEVRENQFEPTTEVTDALKNFPSCVCRKFCDSGRVLSTWGSVRANMSLGHQPETNWCGASDLMWAAAAVMLVMVACVKMWGRGVSEVGIETSLVGKYWNLSQLQIHAIYLRFRRRQWGREMTRWCKGPCPR